MAKPIEEKIIFKFLLTKSDKIIKKYFNFKKVFYESNNDKGKLNETNLFEISLEKSNEIKYAVSLNSTSIQWLVKCILSGDKYSVLEENSKILTYSHLKDELKQITALYYEPLRVFGIPFEKNEIDSILSVINKVNFLIIFDPKTGITELTENLFLDALYDEIMKINNTELNEKHPIFGDIKKFRQIIDNDETFCTFMGRFIIIMDLLSIPKVSREDQILKLNDFKSVPEYVSRRLLSYLKNIKHIYNFKDLFKILSN